MPLKLTDIFISTCIFIVRVLQCGITFNHWNQNKYFVPLTSVATYIVVPTHIVAGDNLCRYSRTILSPQSIYCRQDEIFTLHILSSAKIRTKVCRIYCRPTQNSTVACLSCPCRKDSDVNLIWNNPLHVENIPFGVKSHVN